jgi:hypothetical protein
LRFSLYTCVPGLESFWDQSIISVSGVLTFSKKHWFP